MKAPDPVIDVIDSKGIVESHLKQVLKLEESESKKLLKIYRNIRYELRDRLDMLPYDRFEAQQVRGVLAQVESAIVLLKEQINQQITEASLAVSEKGVSDIMVEVQGFEREFTGAVVEININQVLVAESTRALKLLQYQSSINTYGQDLINRINRILINSTITKMPYSRVVQQVAGASGIFQMEAYKAHRIVRTELHSIYDLSRLEGLRAIKESTVPDLMKISIDPLDARTALDSIAVMGQVRKINEPFKFKGYVTDPRDGESQYIEVKPFMNHPNRPNDRGSTAPYRKEWAKSIK